MGVVVWEWKCISEQLYKRWGRLYNQLNDSRLERFLCPHAHTFAFHLGHFRHDYTLVYTYVTHTPCVPQKNFASFGFRFCGYVLFHLFIVFAYASHRRQTFTYLSQQRYCFYALVALPAFASAAAGPCPSFFGFFFLINLNKAVKRFTFLDMNHPRLKKPNHQFMNVLHSSR